MRIQYIILLTLFIGACIPENPYLSDEEVKEFLKPEKSEFAIIKNNELFTLRGNINNEIEQLTNDGYTKTEVKISWDPNKIAYKKNNEEIIYYNAKDSSFSSLGAGYQQFDWIDSNTLYLFKDDKITFWGGNLPERKLQLPPSVPVTAHTSIISACINDSNQLAYVVDIYSHHFEYQWLVLDNGLDSKIFEYNESDIISNVHFNGEGNLILQFSRTNSEDYIFYKRKQYSDFNEIWNASDINNIDELYAYYSTYIDLPQRNLKIFSKLNSSFQVSYNLVILDYKKHDDERRFIEFSENVPVFIDYK